MYNDLYSDSFSSLLDDYSSSSYGNYGTYGNYGSYGSSSSSLGSSSDADLEAIGAVILGLLGTFAVAIIISLILSIITLIAKWKVFKKAGKKPWEALIAIHNTIVEMEIGGIQTYWYFLQFIPFVGGLAAIVIHFWKCIALAKSFGKGAGFGVLMVFFPFVCYPILGFGKADYVGAQTASATTTTATVETPSVSQPAEPKPTIQTTPEDPNSDQK